MPYTKGSSKKAISKNIKTEMKEGKPKNKLLLLHLAWLKNLKRRVNDMRNKAVSKALQHPNKLGAGAKARKNLNKSDNSNAIIAEYKRGTLHSGSGGVVKSKKQAIAIIVSTNKGRKKK